MRIPDDKLSDADARQERIDSPVQPLTDSNKRQIARIEKRIAYQFHYPFDFINDHLYRLLHPAIVIEVSRIAPQSLVDEMLKMGKEFHLAHTENRPYTLELRRHGLWDVIDKTDLDPGSDFAIAVIRLWLHQQEEPK